MEEAKSNGVKSIDLEALRVSIKTSSTSHRKRELRALEERLATSGKLRPRGARLVFE